MLKTSSVFKRYAIVDEAMLEEAAQKLALLYEREPKRMRKVLPLDR